MPIVLAAILAFIGGFVLTYVVVVGAALGYMSINEVLDRDGGMSMAIMFVLGPFWALVGALTATIVTVLRMNRRARGVALGDMPPPKPRPLPVRLAGALLVAVLTYFAAWAVLWLIGPLRFSSYWAALAVSLLPIGLGLVVGALLAWRSLRRRVSIP